MSAGVQQRGQLERIAERMTAAVGPSGKQTRWQHTALPHGLELVLQRIDGSCRLALAREAPARPSDVEEKICRQSFRVPNWAEAERVQVMRNGKVLNVINVTWRDEADS